jgi:hypothetical protein
MSRLTAKQVEEVIDNFDDDFKATYEATNYKKETYIDVLEEADGEFWYTLETSNWVEVEGLGRLEFVEGYSGGEGGGSNVYSVFKIGDQYFKKTGYYASHYGTDWDGSIYEVVPQEKTITVYKSI